MGQIPSTEGSFLAYSPACHDGTEYLTKERSCFSLAAERGENWWSFCDIGDLTNGKNVLFLHTYAFEIVILGQPKYSEMHMAARKNTDNGRKTPVSSVEVAHLAGVSQAAVAGLHAGRQRLRRDAPEGDDGGEATRLPSQRDRAA